MSAHLPASVTAIWHNMIVIKTKRWCDPAESDDGLRVLVSRYRPRGVSKAEETWEGFLPQLGPSKALHAAYYGKHGESLSWEQ